MKKTTKLSIKELADHLTGYEIVDDVIVCAPDTWYADDGNAEVEYEDCDSGRDAAEQYVEEGDWGDRTNTCWIHVRAWRKGIDSDGDIVEVDSEWHTITLDAEEPECADGEEHDWQSPIEIVGGIAENPGVWGNGGGVIIKEVCMHCGCGKETDTWAQDPDSGQQGLTSVEYEPGKYEDEITEMAKDDEEDE